MSGGLRVTGRSGSGLGGGFWEGSGICGNYIKSIYDIFGAIELISTWQPSI